MSGQLTERTYYSHGTKRKRTRTIHFIKSIEKVNIGGFPFLPNATRLVEQFLDHLIEKSPEEIIREGILPRGTKEEWHSSLEEKVLVGSVKTESDYETYRKNGVYQLPIKQLKPGWQEAKCIALYASKKWHGEKGGIQYVAKIKHIQMQQNDEYVYFKLEPWKKLEHLIRPVGYGIQTYTITTMSLLKRSARTPGNIHEIKGRTNSLENAATFYEAS
ncbi:hypothetical protein ACT7DH_04085 [Bacillus pacificus]